MNALQEHMQVVSVTEEGAGDPEDWWTMTAVATRNEAAKRENETLTHQLQTIPLLRLSPRYQRHFLSLTESQR